MTDWPPFPPAPDSLPRPVVDSHCHLDLVEAQTGLGVAEALHRAAAVGVTGIAQIGYDLASSRWSAAAAERWPTLIAGVALHPNEAARMADAELSTALAEISALAGRDGVRAVGETGLDFFRTSGAAGQARQRNSFAAHIAMAKQHDRTLVIHDRDAHQAVLEVLDAEGSPPRLVMHCFSGDTAFARACLDRGAYLSFAGPVTFKANAGLREALAITPLDRVLVETDAPYLTPVPHRGRPNSSYLLPHTVRAMAEVLLIDLVTLCRALTANAYAAFAGPWG